MQKAAVSSPAVGSSVLQVFYGLAEKRKNRRLRPEQIAFCAGVVVLVSLGGQRGTVCMLCACPTHVTATRPSFN